MQHSHLRAVELPLKPYSVAQLRRVIRCQIDEEATGRVQQAVSHPSAVCVLHAPVGQSGAAVPFTLFGLFRSRKR